MCWILTTVDEKHFVSMMEWEGFGDHLLRFILSSTRVKIHFIFTLAYEGFCQHVLINILSIPWHRMGLINTS
jgi:hypothetical protein